MTSGPCEFAIRRQVARSETPSGSQDASSSTTPLEASKAYDSYVQDAEGHDDVQSFFQQCTQQDAERAKKCHKLLGQFTGDGGLSRSS